ncbi:hypothetical protein M9Y10_000326 [Tritrichomonas musculus]|uniref:Uncharacterized protein n=1 Tax=Tritrichomonas musculus TaxID=1915356 RepID=A0ABR2L4Y8_9EUKA
MMKIRANSFVPFSPRMILNLPTMSSISSTKVIHIFTQKSFKNDLKKKILLHFINHENANNLIINHENRTNRVKAFKNFNQSRNHLFRSIDLGFRLSYFSLSRLLHESYSEDKNNCKTKLRIFY